MTAPTTEVTGETITTAQLNELWADACAKGDSAMAYTCRLALGWESADQSDEEQEHARTRCAAVWNARHKEVDRG